MSNDFQIKPYEVPGSLTQLVETINNVDLAIFGSTDKMNMIMTRGVEEKIGDFKAITPAHVDKMVEQMPEINRATSAFGRTQSAYMNYLMTVSAYTPVRNARQLLAEIERRRQAVKENIFKIKHQMIELKTKEQDYNDMLEEYLNLEKSNDLKGMDKLKYKIMDLAVSIQELEANIADTNLYLEGAMKTIYQHQQKYDEIVKNNHLENWDEVDFEKEEARYHVTTAFSQALEDTCSRGGMIEKGDLIYMRQIGIHPIVATMELNKHMQKVSQLIDGNEKLGITYDCHDEMVAFLLEMADKYADSCLKVLKQKGIEASWFDEDSSFKTRNKQ